MLAITAASAKKRSLQYYRKLEMCGKKFENTKSRKYWKCITTDELL